MINAIAIDDEPPALNIITSFCEGIEEICLQKVFTGTHEALKYIKNYPVDLVFLDIQMPSLTGIDFHKAMTQQPMVIFTTAYSEYAVEGFNLNALDYLLKPFTKERFVQSINKAIEYNRLLKQNAADHYLFIRADYSLLKIYLDDIVYIESLDDYIKIHLYGQKPVIARITMKAILEKLPVSKFIRIHRSFIIAINSIKSVRNKVITLNTGINITLGSSYEASFLRVFKV